jgi:hypothetical protein
LVTLPRSGGGGADMGALSASTSSVNWLVEDDILLKNAVEVIPRLGTLRPQSQFVDSVLLVPMCQMSIEASDVVLGLFLMERDGFRGIRVYRVVRMMILFVRGKRKEF